MKIKDATLAQYYISENDYSAIVEDKNREKPCWKIFIFVSVTVVNATYSNVIESMQ